MVDTPRFNPALAKRLQEMGGVKYIFLTHKVSSTHIRTYNIPLASTFPLSLLGLLASPSLDLPAPLISDPE